MSISMAFYLIGNIFHIFAIYKFSNVFFDKNKVNKYLEFLMYTVYYISNTVMYLKFENFIVNIATNLLLFFVSHFYTIPEYHEKLFLQFLSIQFQWYVTHQC